MPDHADLRWAASRGLKKEHIKVSGHLQNIKLDQPQEATQHLNNEGCLPHTTAFALGCMHAAQRDRSAKVRCWVAGG